MRKGIASHILGIVLIIAVFAFFLLLIVYTWINTTNEQASELLCSTKILNYCTDWMSNGFKDRPWNWNDKAPTSGCEQYHITEPVSPDDCKGIAKL